MNIAVPTEVILLPRVTEVGIVNPSNAELPNVSNVDGRVIDVRLLFLKQFAFIEVTLDGIAILLIIYMMELFLLLSN